MQPDRQTIHGCTIPPGHVCVMVTTTYPNQTASLILGDKSENSLLERGKFFLHYQENFLRLQSLPVILRSH